MRTGLRGLLVIWTVIGLTAVAGGPVKAAEDRVEARIGIQIKSGDEVTRARSRDLVRTGDYLRVYVQPEASARYVYVVHADDRRVTLLNRAAQEIKGPALILPSARTFYQVDGNSDMERFTVICGPAPLPEVAALEDAGMAPDQWMALRDDLAQGGEIVLTRRSEPRIGIAGNVRGWEEAGCDDPFLEVLQAYSGKGLLVQSYAFQVQR
jgi:hypothetical protein